MAHARQQRSALQLIFAFFLGLMMTAFIGVGVYTFHPHGLAPFEAEIRVLRDQQQKIRDARGADGFTDTQQAKLSELTDELREAEARRRKHDASWARTSSIILLVLATLVMGVSLVGADRLPVISNGLLLGGVFSMLYGTGWSLASGESQTRFWVLGFAVLITLLLGYLRFVRGRAREPAPGPAAEGSGDLEARVQALEHKVDAAAEAFQRDGSSSRPG